MVKLTTEEWFDRWEVRFSGWKAKRLTEAQVLEEYQEFWRAIVGDCATAFEVMEENLEGKGTAGVRLQSVLPVFDALIKRYARLLVTKVRSSNVKVKDFAPKARGMLESIARALTAFRQESLSATSVPQVRLLFVTRVAKPLVRAISEDNRIPDAISDAAVLLQRAS